MNLYHKDQESEPGQDRYQWVEWKFGKDRKKAIQTPTNNQQNGIQTCTTLWYREETNVSADTGGETGEIRAPREL